MPITMRPACSVSIDSAAVSCSGRRLPVVHLGPAASRLLRSRTNFSRKPEQTSQQKRVSVVRLVSSASPAPSSSSYDNSLASVSLSMDVDQLYTQEFKCPLVSMTQ